MKNISIQAARVGHSDCARCSMRNMVLFANLEEELFTRMHTPIDDLEIPSDTAVFQQGNAADYLYTVRSGYLKIVRLSADGSQRILRVLRAGDLAGLEATLGMPYHHSVVSLSKARLCRIPVSVVRDLNQRSEALRMQLMEKWAAALHESEKWFAEMNTGAARQRVARLLLAMRPLEAPQHGGISTSILFKRDDIGAMLDITLETSSRVLSAFIREGLLARPASAHGVVQILDVHALEQVAAGA